MWRTFALFTWIVLATPAFGQGTPLVFEFATDDPVPVFGTAFSVEVGQKVGIRVYVRDTSAGAAAILADRGLGSAGVKLTYTSAGGAAAVVSAADIRLNSVANGGQFDFVGPNSRQVEPGAATAFLGDISPDAEDYGVRPDAAGRILLATFSLTGQTVGSVNLAAVDRNPGSASDTAGFENGLPLDGLFAAGPFTATLDVTPVPEPAAALALGAVVLVVRRRLGS